MAEKQINGRIVHKHDTEANWNKAINFIPKNGEIIIYDPDSNYSYARVKVGNGTTKVTSLPFIDNAIKTAQTNLSDTVNSVKNNSITALSASGRNITYTKGDGTTGTITTQDNNTTYSAGTGLSLSGTTFNHKNSITAATAQGDASKTLAFGDTFTIPTITYDAQGHITGKGTTTMTMPAGPVAKEGNPVSEIGIEGVGFSAKTTFEPKQEGSGEPSPDNIRPISGFNSAKLTRCGKNLINPQIDTDNYYASYASTNADGSITVSNSSSSKVYPATVWTRLPSGTYTAKFTRISGSNPTEVFLQCNDTADYSSNIAALSVKTFTLSEETQVRVMVIAEPSASYTASIQIEQGSTATAYEPYQGDTFTADFGQTIYGGTLDWNAGVLTVEWGYKAFDGSEAWSSGGSGTNSFYTTVNTLEKTNDYITSIKCSTFRTFSTHSSLPGNVGISGFYDSNNNYPGENWIYINNGVSTTVAELKEWLSAQYTAGTPVQVCYKLATPQIIQLTPQEIKAIKGINTLYSNAQELTVIGRVDTMYQLSKLAERVAALESR